MRLKRFEFSLIYTFPPKKRTDV